MPAIISRVLYSLYHLFRVPEIKYIIPLEDSELVKMKSNIKLLYPPSKNQRKINKPEDEFYEKFFEIDKDSVVLDLGAAVGEFTLKAAKKTGSSGLVISLEPNPANYNYLKTNLKWNNIENVKTIRKAAWYKKDNLDFYISESVASHSLKEEGSGGLKSGKKKK